MLAILAYTALVVATLAVAIAAIGRLLPPRDDPRPFRCLSCHCAYASASCLARHVEAQHGEMFCRVWDGRGVTTSPRRA